MPKNDFITKKIKELKLLFLDIEVGNIDNQRAFIDWKKSIIKLFRKSLKLQKQEILKKIDGLKYEM